MSFDAQLAARRYGYGLSPHVPPPATLDAALASIGTLDPVEAKYPLPGFGQMRSLMSKRRRFLFYARKVGDDLAAKDAKDRADAIKDQLRDEHATWFIQVMLRRIHGSSGFRERLVAFWADHFTAFGGGGLLPLAAPLYAEEAVRPHLTGSFAQLLISCVTHPLMVRYLDQGTSIGPNSRAARSGNRQRGLNENLAREVMELHTLGVDAGYSQTDVRELAKLFTGMGSSMDFGFRFRPGRAEPGAETVLGVSYEGGDMDSIRAALTDLAHHPATARHIAIKLVTHFVADTPPEALVEAVEWAYLDTNGDLLACYAALLGHPQAWVPEPRNIRTPDEFVSAALRALAPSDAALQMLSRKDIRKLFLRPMAMMGQDWMHPKGPDGFDEADEAWVTPTGISARMEWAMNAPARLLDALPDHESFLAQTLGDDVSPALRFAVSAAENRAVAIGLVLSSPAFQRR